MRLAAAKPRIPASYGAVDALVGRRYRAGLRGPVVAPTVSRLIRPSVTEVPMRRWPLVGFTGYRH